MKAKIIVRGARQHNLKGIDLEIPRRTLTVITGPSGSGKSSLAFDTIYAEGQRRYMESLSAYARQFLERMEKPSVDYIDGLSPSVAIEQKNPTKTSRSTVGTATEVYDYLRLLWARVGHTHCRACGRQIRPDTVQSATDAVLALPEGTRFSIAFPLTVSDRVTHTTIVENLRAQGFLRVASDGVVLHLDQLGDDTDLAAAREILVIVDRLAASRGSASRVAEAIATAFVEGDGECVVVLAAPATRTAEATERLRFTESYRCAYDGTLASAPTPQLFSFNNPRGACPSCNGFGAVLEYDEALIVRYPERSLREGAIHPWTMPRYDNKRRALAEFARRSSINMDVPWRNLSDSQRALLLNARSRGYKGIFPFLGDLEEKRYKQYIRVFLRQYQTARECQACAGAKLQPDALAVLVAGRNIAEVSEMAIDTLCPWLDELPLSEYERAVAASILREACSRTRFLLEVGLGYLSLHRGTRTLSGGEAQRIALANSLGSSLVDTLYVLDEPSIGLHARDLNRLLRLLARLRDAGNTVLVVEHDLDAIRSADFMVELGPGSGEHGGQVVFSGPISRAHESPLTGKYLSGEREIAVPSTD
ncbi:MAG: excinuclease ABC subunit A, partial [Gemmatimonadaceae bacterium]